MERREFLKTTCSYCLAASAGLLLTSLSSCATIPVLDAEVVNHTLTIPLSAFARTDLQIVRPGGLLYDIALHRETNGTFRALVLLCTHASTQLSSTGSGYNCPAHGSTFDIEGRVTRGPAQLPLHELATEQAHDSVLIHLRA